MNELLDAAIAIWSEEGLDRLTMNAVAARAGKTRGTVYHHFVDRNDLVLSAQKRLDERLEAIFDVAKPDSRDDYMVVPGIMVDSPELLRSYLLRLVGESPRNDPLMKKARHHYREVRDRGWLRPGVDPDSAAVISIGTWFAAMLMVDLQGSKRARRAAATAFARTLQTVLERSVILPAESRAS